MAKKGAQSSGSGKANSRGKDAAMSAHLPPLSITWNNKPTAWPYHNNLGKARDKSGKK